jgi:hypothetical protein
MPWFSLRSMLPHFKAQLQQYLERLIDERLLFGPGGGRAAPPSVLDIIRPLVIYLLHDILTVFMPELIQNFHLFSRLLVCIILRFAL